MIRLETIKKTAEKMGLEVTDTDLTNGKRGIFISLEVTIPGQYGRSVSCKPLDSATEAQLFRYLQRYKVPYDYRGNYTSLLIQEP